MHILGWSNYFLIPSFLFSTDFFQVQVTSCARKENFRHEKKEPGWPGPCKKGQKERPTTWKIERNWVRAFLGSAFPLLQTQKKNTRELGPETHGNVNLLKVKASQRPLGLLWKTKLWPGFLPLKSDLSAPLSGLSGTRYQTRSLIAKATKAMNKTSLANFSLDIPQSFLRISRTDSLIHSQNKGS